MGREKEPCLRPMPSRASRALGKETTATGLADEATLRLVNKTHGFSLTKPTNAHYCGQFTYGSMERMLYDVTLLLC